MRSIGVFLARVVWICGIAIFTLAPCAGQRQDSRKAGLWITSTGGKVNPFVEARKRTQVLIFVLMDCPLANVYAPEVNRIVEKYGPKGVAFYLVYDDPDITARAAQSHMADYGYRCTAVLDANHTLSKMLGATVSPQAVVLGRRGEILYSGRIDDRAVALGKVRPNPTRQDLRLALDAILKGKKVSMPKSPAIGCILPH